MNIYVITLYYMMGNMLRGKLSFIMKTLCAVQNRKTLVEYLKKIQKRQFYTSTTA